jgi:prepilin-type N-terminal cleavage/methylation domain-containing protein
MNSLGVSFVRMALQGRPKRFPRQHLTEGSENPSSPMVAGKLRGALGFTLLEVVVALTVLAVGVALTLSLISGSLGNIRKVQLRTRTIEHAESVMELALLDDSIQRPTVFTGDFEDGTRWSVHVEEYIPPDPLPQPPGTPQGIMQVKLLSYTVEMFSPDSRVSDYSLRTLKLANVPAEDQITGLPQ